MKFTNYDKAIMIGLLIGDGIVNEKGKVTITCKNKDYITYKAKLLHSVTGGKNISIYELNKNLTYLKNGIVQKTQHSTLYCIRRQSRDFIQFQQMLYKDNKKTINREVLDLLQPVSLALWWMDAGYIKQSQFSGQTLIFNTHFSKENTELIKQYFKEKYDIKWDVIHTKNNKWILRCSVCEGKKFLDIIQKYIVPSMSYKILNI